MISYNSPLEQTIVVYVKEIKSFFLDSEDPFLCNPIVHFSVNPPCAFFRNVSLYHTICVFLNTHMLMFLFPPTLHSFCLFPPVSFHLDIKYLAYF